jgi:hypothetical protein
VEGQRLEHFATQMRRLFVPASYPQNLTSRDLRVLLDTTVDDLQRQARGSGVELPSDYWFSFGGHKQTLNFQQNMLEPLVAQLAEIDLICRVLFDARINQLTRVKRPAAPGESTSVLSADFLAESKPSTNDWAVTTPYEVTFKSFSGELGGILDSFARSPHSIIVRNLVVDSAGRSGASDGLFDPYGLGMANPYGGLMQPPVNPYGMAPGGRPGGMRPGMDPRYGGMMPPPVAQSPRPRPGGLATVVDEKPLTITLSLDVIRLRPEKTTR